MDYGIWSDTNREYLLSCIGEIKSFLKEHLDATKKPEESLKPRFRPQWADDNFPPSIETISRIFGLSSFERSLLLLCAGAELDSEISQLCFKSNLNQNQTYPTFGLALTVLPDSHWDAIVPTSPLRRFKLISMQDFQQLPLTATPLRIEERVLHYLIGISYIEKHLHGMLKPVKITTLLTHSHKQIVDQIVSSIQKNDQKISLPTVQLWGTGEMDKMMIAKSVCSQMGLGLWILPEELVPTKQDDLDSFIELWARESLLLGSGLYISAEDIEPSVQKFIRLLINDVSGIVFLGTHEQWPILNQSMISFEIRKPEKSEQREIWKYALNGKLHSDNLTNEISKIVNQFDLDTSSIVNAASKIASQKDVSNLSSVLWESGKSVARPRIGDLAQQILPKAKLDDLVLPEREKQILQDVLIHVANRDKVYEKWGFEQANSRGLGITTLFVGDSGTGKTTAAEALANELNLDLFRIDLSMVLSKYIGETPKHLRQIFEAAESGGAILFFDEADAIIGKRSEVRDSHDRYANVEVGYLLQRMESYRGLAILATNMQNSMDPAFIRRIRFIVKFPFPDEKSRIEIWKRAFPSSTPTQDIDMQKLGRLNITGGSIHNIALNASFLAANENMPVNMSHIRRATKTEYDKLERQMTGVEFRD